MELTREATLLDFFYHWEKHTPNQTYLKQPFGDEFKDFTWAEVGQQARKLATYFNSIGLPPRSNIALISKNCAEWIISDIAIMISGHISVPMYATLTADQTNQVLLHSDAKLVMIGKLDDWPAMKPGIPKDIKCISFPTYNPDSEHVQWDRIMQDYTAMKGDIKPNRNDNFTTIYTSGTTGNPKGVMLSLDAFSNVLFDTRDRTHLDIKNARFFSYLPLCHIAERNIVEGASLVTGGTIYFAETLESFSKNLNDAKPTHFLAVPRIWTKFQQGILGKMPQKKLDLLLKIPILSSIVKNKIKKGLGLNKTVICLTGAAPMPVYLFKWFRKLGIEIKEAYGMTENFGAVCMVPPNVQKDGYVGKLYDNSQVKILPETGEILTKSAWTMLGYYKEPTLTAETIDSDGWLHTGDVGELDAENYLKITGRVKEMYKTSKGEYVAPAQIEFGFAENTNIEQVCVVGINLPQPVALMVLSEIGKSLSKEQLESSIIETLTILNPKLKSYEKIKKVVILSEPWTVENNKMTPTLKIKRAVIEKEFESKLEAWYNHPDSLIWY